MQGGDDEDKIQNESGPGPENYREVDGESGREKQVIGKSWNLSLQFFYQKLLKVLNVENLILLYL